MLFKAVATMTNRPLPNNGKHNTNTRRRPWSTAERRLLMSANIRSVEVFSWRSLDSSSKLLVRLHRHLNKSTFQSLGPPALVQGGHQHLQTSSPKHPVAVALWLRRCPRSLRVSVSKYKCEHMKCCIMHRRMHDILMLLCSMSFILIHKCVQDNKYRLGI